ncbi:MAG TPA: prephenate dehydratase [Pyrinomonadaceae bacterium]|nr:prephenate dehydratase [Pyrinomonadaceae bacterium]
MSEPIINNPRAEIDAIDTEILNLLNKRAAIALRVGAAKTKVDTSLCDPKRESEVLERLAKENAGPFDAQSIENIFQRIIDESLHLQQKTYRKPFETAENIAPENLEKKARVAFQGEKGSFSEAAVIGILGKDCQTVPCQTFEDLYRSIEDGKADYILSPLENSLVGSVHRCYDLLLHSNLHIVAEIILPISHFLVGATGANFEDIKTVESHPVALAQCERFFAAHTELKGVAADDTAGSVRRVIESGDKSRAAIGGKRTAEIYGGKILREHIEDHAENYTRFVLLSPSANDSEKGGKVSLIVRLKHEPGALHNALRPFVRRGIDLSKIESRPIKGAPWQFNFYFDLKTPASESELRGALDEIKEQAEEVRYLGRYSRIELADEKLEEIL